MLNSKISSSNTKTNSKSHKLKNFEFSPTSNANQSIKIQQKENFVKLLINF